MLVVHAGQPRRIGQNYGVDLNQNDWLLLDLVVGGIPGGSCVDDRSRWFSTDCQQSTQGFFLMVFCHVSDPRSRSSSIREQKFLDSETNVAPLFSGRNPREIGCPWLPLPLPLPPRDAALITRDTARRSPRDLAPQRGQLGRGGENQLPLVRPDPDRPAYGS
ncbi:hypothetical protein [Plantactinospora alkalitolerans]|uniref:hypothetical protein n=1 Tax=Plantactinospora alkalitolerans TaxID=2789879 RepID=UPI001E326F7C|nr:hypothetical protein [Plantactinospora alkalitolerans]